MTDRRLLKLTRSVLLRQALYIPLMLSVVTGLWAVLASSVQNLALFIASMFMYVGPAVLYFFMSAFAKLDIPLLISFGFSRKEAVNASLINAVLSSLLGWLPGAVCVLLSLGSANPLRVSRPFYLLYGLAAFLFCSIFGIASGLLKSRRMQALSVLVLILAMMLIGSSNGSAAWGGGRWIDISIPGFYYIVLALFVLGALLSIRSIRKRTNSLFL